MPISVVVVEDDALLREIITQRLELDTEIDVVGTFSNSVELAKKIFPHGSVGPEFSVDVAVMDVWPDRQSESQFRIPDSTEVFTFLRAAGLEVQALFVTSMDREYVEAACYALADQHWDYLNKSNVSKGQDLVEAVKHLATAKGSKDD